MTLCRRLIKVASLVRNGARVADIGTDHAKLPVYLIQQGVSPCCIASDIMQGPLDNAKKTVDKYRLNDKISLRLASGLDGISQDETDDIVIAGMGGEMIVNIIEAAAWCREKHLILQPMTAVDKLRIFLAESGFLIEKEIAVTDAGKHYCAMSVTYDGVKREYSPEYPYVGNITDEDAESRQYLVHQLTKLEKIKSGLNNSNQKDLDRQYQLDQVISLIKRRIK